MSQFIVETVTEVTKSNTPEQEYNTPIVLSTSAPVRPLVRPPVIPSKTSKPTVPARKIPTPLAKPVLSDTNNNDNNDNNETEPIPPELPVIEEAQEATIVNVLAMAMKDRRNQIHDEEDSTDNMDDSNWVDEDFID